MHAHKAAPAEGAARLLPIQTRSCEVTKQQHCTGFLHRPASGGAGRMWRAVCLTVEIRVLSRGEVTTGSNGSGKFALLSR